MDKIGKYKIVSKIGQGATSHVYKGKDESLGRFVAVKTIAAEVSKDETLRKRFRREAESAALLNHPNIITVYDFGEEQDKLYIAMELLEGVDLKQALAEGRLATLDQKLDVMYQICEGLAFAHSHGIFHRDLKPANLHVLGSGKLKIMDFGLARLSGSDMTRTGLVMGTPHYMSPEQVRGEHVDARSDVFAMGCVFYEILTGKKPFDAESLHSVLYKVMQAEPPSAAEAVPGLPHVIVQVVEKALAKKPADRFQDASEFRAVLEAAREAIASGRGDEPLAGIHKPLPAAAPGTSRSAVTQPIERVSTSVTGPDPASSPSPASTSRRPDRPSSGSRSRHVPVAARPAGPGPILWIGGAVLLAVLVVGTLLWSRSPRTVSTSPPPTSGQISTLARELAATEARNARNKLDAGDYADAALRAERALKFDPDNADAKKVRAEATKAQEKIAAAVAELQGTDDSKRASAYWDLLETAPDNAAADDVPAAIDAGFRARADESRKLMADAQRGAAPASRSDAFGDGAKLAREAETSYKAGAFARAARDFMRARERFRRAR